MALSKTMAFAAGLAAVFSATQAEALELKCGYTPAEISTAMKTEAQKPLLKADRLAAGHPAQLFTANSNGQGYLVEGNRPSSEASTSFCVVMKLSDVRLYDARKAMSPSAFRGQVLTEALKAGQKNGESVYLQGNVHNEQGQLTNTIMTVGGNYSQSDGIMLFSGNTPKVTAQAGFVELKYSKEALAILDRPVQTAAFSPK